MKEKKADPALFEYEMTQVILQLKGEFTPERMSVNNDELRQIQDATNISLEWSSKPLQVELDVINLPSFPETIDSTEISCSGKYPNVYMPSLDVAIDVGENKINLPTPPLLNRIPLVQNTFQDYVIQDRDVTPVFDFDIGGVLNNASIKANSEPVIAMPEIEKLNIVHVRMPDVEIKEKALEDFPVPPKSEINLNWGKVQSSIVVTSVFNLDVDSVLNNTNIETSTEPVIAIPEIEKLNIVHVKMPDVEIKEKSLEDFPAPPKSEINLDWGKMQSSMIAPGMPTIRAVVFSSGVDANIQIESVDSAMQLPNLIVDLDFDIAVPIEADFSFETIDSVRISPFDGVSLQNGDIVMQTTQIPKHSSTEAICLKELDITFTFPNINGIANIDSYIDAILPQCPAYAPVAFEEHDIPTDFSLDELGQPHAHYDTEKLNSDCKKLFAQCEDLLTEDWQI